MTAALIGTNVSYLLFAFLPPVLWLIFYLREDRNPEPKTLIIFTFIGGMAAALLAIVFECLYVGALTDGSCRSGAVYSLHPLIIFGGIAFIEEYLKYFAVKTFVLRRCENDTHVCEFDEPIDAMVYMMTAAMGFAALENALFVFPFFFEILETGISTLPFTYANVLAGLDVSTNRFLGANLLHALSSGIVGFFLARAWFSPNRKHFVGLGILFATVLHTGFNYLILTREMVSQATFYIILLLSLMAVVVFIEFERLRKTTFIPRP